MSGVSLDCGWAMLGRVGVAGAQCSGLIAGSNELSRTRRRSQNEVLGFCVSRSSPGSRILLYSWPHLQTIFAPVELEPHSGRPRGASSSSGRDRVGKAIAGQWLLFKTSCFCQSVRGNPNSQVAHIPCLASLSVHVEAEGWGGHT